MHKWMTNIVTILNIRSGGLFVTLQQHHHRRIVEGAYKAEVQGIKGPLDQSSCLKETGNSFSRKVSETKRRKMRRKRHKMS